MRLMTSYQVIIHQRHQVGHSGNAMDCSTGASMNHILLENQMGVDRIDVVCEMFLFFFHNRFSIRFQNNISYHTDHPGMECSHWRSINETRFSGKTKDVKRFKNVQCKPLYNDLQCNPVCKNLYCKTVCKGLHHKLSHSG